MAFVGIVGLYACTVRRLKSEKRKPANFLDCFALASAYCGLFCVCRLGYCGCFVPVVCGFLLGCGWCFFFPSDKTKTERVCFALRLYSVLVSLF